MGRKLISRSRGPSILFYSIFGEAGFEFRRSAAGVSPGKTVRKRVRTQQAVEKQTGPRCDATTARENCELRFLDCGRTWMAYSVLAGVTRGLNE